MQTNKARKRADRLTNFPNTCFSEPHFKKVKQALIKQSNRLLQYIYLIQELKVVGGEIISSNLRHIDPATTLLNDLRNLGFALFPDDEAEAPNFLVPSFKAEERRVSNHRSFSEQWDILREGCKLKPSLVVLKVQSAENIGNHAEKNQLGHEQFLSM